MTTRSAHLFPMTDALRPDACRHPKAKGRRQLLGRDRRGCGRHRRPSARPGGFGQRGWQRTDPLPLRDA